MGWIFITFIILLKSLAVGFIVYKAKKNKKISLLEKEMLVYKLEALSQQINPHFIFNILNSIQYNLKNKNYEITNTYIARFATLLRMIFEHSKQHAIPIHSEIEALQLYLELEQMRLQNRFRFSIEKMNEFDLSYYYVPSLLFQPFLEYSIWYSLFNKQENGGIIEIWLKEENECLICEIMDNGTGYDEKLMFNEKIHKGLAVTHKRIDIYNELYKTQIKFSVENLVHHHKFQSGTRAIFIIPKQKLRSN